MKRLEHLLIILGEECSELHKEICKALRFGVFEQRDLPTSNDQRIFKEYNDLIAVVEMVNDEVKKRAWEIAKVTLGDRGIMYVNPEFITAKKSKVEKYLRYSRECGTLQD